MRDFQNSDLIRLLADEEPSFRMLALHFLSEGYGHDASILDEILNSWDRWGVEHAYPEFPLLSHIPIAATSIEECCQRAMTMVRGRKLTELPTRCAGKLLEQIVCLPATELEPFLPLISETSKTSKIFFRVDLGILQQRIEMLESTSDQLAHLLDSAIEALSAQSDNAAAFHQGLAALEALRFRHPNYIDMTAAIAHSPVDHGVRAVSFQLSIHSLIQFEHLGAEAALAKHLIDARESIHSNAMEGLVRIGSPLAAAHLITQFEYADGGGQRWIARGLQRLRAAGLAEEIAQLRATTLDSALWLMLLVAEVRQLDLVSQERIAEDLERVQTFSGALIDALKVYVRMYQSEPSSSVVHQAFVNYIKRTDHNLQKQILAYDGKQL